MPRVGRDKSPVLRLMLLLEFWARHEILASPSIRCMDEGLEPLISLGETARLLELRSSDQELVDQNQYRCTNTQIPRAEEGSSRRGRLR